MTFSSVKTRSFLSRLAKRFRLTVKHVGCSFAALFKSRSYPFFGVPSGLSSVSAVNELHPPSQIDLQPPKGVEEATYWRFADKKASLPSYGYFVIKRGLATHLGGNLDRRGQLITTYLHTVDGKAPRDHDLFYFSSRRFRPKIVEKERVISMTAGWQSMFYHWMYEVLPRFALIEGLEGMLYIDQGCRFQRESLALMGIDKERVIDASTIQGVRAEELIVPATPTMPLEWSCRFLRDRLKVDARKKKRLYLSRGDADKRRVTNEEELLPILERHGFEVKCAAALPFVDQIKLFKEAEIVVGPHGAGFSHLVFCSRDTPVLELFSPAYTHACYWQLASACGLSYHYLFAEGERFARGEEPPIDPDLIVDPKRFEKALIYALADR